MTEVRRVSRDDASLGHPKDLEDGSNVLLGGFGWMPKPVSPLPLSPTAVDEREEDALSIASSMPPLEFWADVEEGADPSPGCKDSPSVMMISRSSAMTTPASSAVAPPLSVGPSGPTGRPTSPATPRMQLQRPRVPKLSTIVEHIQISTWVDGVMIHRETKERTYYQDVLIDCTFALSRLGTGQRSTRNL